MRTGNLGGILENAGNLVAVELADRLAHNSLGCKSTTRRSVTAAIYRIAARQVGEHFIAVYAQVAIDRIRKILADGTSPAGCKLKALVLNSGLVSQNTLGAIYAR